MDKKFQMFSNLEIDPGMSYSFLCCGSSCGFRSALGLHEPAFTHSMSHCQSSHKSRKKANI